MYNRLVKSSPWGEGSDFLPLDRIFEYTSKSIEDEFTDDNNLVRFDELRRLPCVFMQEGMHNDRLARIGTIHHARVSGKTVTIEYSYEPDITPIPNSIIYARRIDFGVNGDWEFSRTHWSVKNVDLYRAVLRNLKSVRARPTVFNIPEVEKIDQTLLSAMMPFDPSFGGVYKCLKATAKRAGLESARADDIWENPSIIADVVGLIDRSRIVIADCTGRNPNVFYEVGIAHTLGREVILITQNAADIPFDLQHIRHVQYLNNAQGLKALGKTLESRIATLLNLS